MSAESRTGATPPDGDLFLGFFYLLRARGIRTSPTEWMALVDALERGLHGSSLIGFYSLSRALLVKDEAQFDEFDRAFAEYFGQIEGLAEIEKKVWEWLERPIESYPVDPALRRVLDS
ncbi:MAG: hypothetical protein D6806_02410, partial [Deltaproteobacteria bacterium]